MTGLKKDQGEEKKEKNFERAKERIAGPISLERRKMR